MPDLLQRIIDVASRHRSEDAARVRRGDRGAHLGEVERRHLVLRGPRMYQHRVRSGRPSGHRAFPVVIAHRRPYWSGMLPHPQYGSGVVGADAEYLQRIHLLVPDNTSVRPPVAEVERELELSSGLQHPRHFGGGEVDRHDDRPEADAAISAPVSSSVITRPSARVNTDRCDRSHRAKAPLMASARSRNVCDGPTAKTRPGHGHRSSPRPPSSSTVTDNHVRAMTRGCHRSAGVRLPPHPFEPQTSEVRMFEPVRA